MAEQTGIELSGKQVRRILEQKKYAYLWAKYTLEDKQDPKNRKAFKEKLEGYLEASKASPDKLQNGELIIKWGRKIKNKGNAVIAS